MKERLLGRPQAENRQLTMYEFLFGVDEPDAVPPPELLLNSDSPAQSYRLREFGEQRIEPVPAVDLEALTGDLAARLELNSSATLPDRKTAESLKKTLADRNLRVIAAEKDKLANTIDRLQMQLQLAILSDDLRRKRLKKIESRLHSLGDLESRIEAEYLSQEKYFKLWQTVQAAAGSRDLLQLAHYLSPLDEQVKTAASQYHEASANYSLALEGFFTDSAREAQRHLGRQLQQMRISLKKEINRLISENINRHHENMVRLITLTDSARRSSMQLAEQRTAIEEYEKALRHGQPALHESQKELSAALEAAKVRLQDLRNVLPDEKEQLLRSYHVMQALGLENST